MLQIMISTHKLLKSETYIRFGFLLALICVAIFLILRGWGMYPSVFPDEYVHSMSARNEAFSTIEIPSYLYYVIYRITFIFGESYLDVARILNVTFYIIGCYIVYLTASTVTDPKVASLIGIITALSPMNSYTTYFMPESIYFLLFWALVYVLCVPVYQSHSNIKQWTLSGCLLGLLSLVKPHAVFIYPSVIIYAFIFYDINKKIIIHLIIFTIIAGLIKFGVGYLIAGQSGLTFFGSMYTVHAQTVASNLEVMFSAWRQITVNLLGNLFLLTSVLGLGLVTFLTPSDWSDAILPEKRLRIIGASLFLILVPMVSVFSTSVALLDDNVDHRIYMRYYSFIFPLTYIVVGARLNHMKDANIAIDKSIIGVICIIFSMAPIYYLTRNRIFYPFSLYFTDTPEFFLLQIRPETLVAVSLVSLLVTILWYYRESIGLKAYIYAFLPAVILVSIQNGPKVFEQRYKSLPQDLAGLFIRDRIPPEDHKHMTFVGNNPLVLYHIAMYTTSSENSIFNIDQNTPLETIEELFNDNKWLIVNGLANEPDCYVAIWRYKGVTIYRLESAQVDLDK